MPIDPVAARACECLCVAFQILNLVSIIYWIAVQHLCDIESEGESPKRILLLNFDLFLFNIDHGNIPNSEKSYGLNIVDSLNVFCIISLTLPFEGFAVAVFERVLKWC